VDGYLIILRYAEAYSAEPRQGKRFRLCRRSGGEPIKPFFMARAVEPRPLHAQEEGAVRWRYGVCSKKAAGVRGPATSPVFERLGCFGHSALRALQAGARSSLGHQRPGSSRRCCACR
jgi:hypothetical protein